ncbi:MAG: 2,3-bisphosphoglycerate-independent phosphoglycerate mutase, partial [Nitrospiria bacterium]
MTKLPNPPKPLVLIILDGWGINVRTKGNAVVQANPPFFQSLLENYPSTTLDASGESVGLPDGQMGNSEVGHINIGAGRIVYQGLTRISKAISDGSFFLNPSLHSCLSAVKSAKGTLHLMGLLSDGGVHSHIDHLDAILDLSQREGIQQLRVHPFLDGRDTPPRSGLGYLQTLEEMLKKKQPTGADWKIATVMGRFFSMDRDQRWDRIESAYDAMVSGAGVHASSALSAVQKSYDDGTGDEFVKPVIISEKETPVGTIQDNDGIFFFNFRADRARQLTHAFVDNVFDFFRRKSFPVLSSFVSMTSYEEVLDCPVAFSPVQLNQVLGEVLSQRGLRQLRIAETEKYAHVTYFLNGGREKVFENEERILIPSPRDVKTYDQKPAMSAFEVC